MPATTTSVAARSQLALKHVRHGYGDRLLLDDVSLTVPPGEHVGIVGENGAGKSTLLRLVAGVEQPIDGFVSVHADGGLGHLGQTLDLPPSYSVQQAVDHALAELRELEQRMRSLEADLSSDEALTEYGEAMAAYEARDGYAADARVAAALDGLGLAHLGRDRLLGTLSGGEQARLALACLLAAAPELLLLDEPTNHLDAAALAWLEDRLRAHRGTVVAVSHDRLFLDRVTSAITEVDADRRTVVRYSGGYAGYLAEKAAARARWEQAYQTWRDERAALTERAATTARRVGYERRRDGDKMGYDFHGGRVLATISRQVRNAQEMLRRLDEDPVPKPPAPLRFAARPAAAGNVDGPLVRVEDVRVGDRLAVPEFAVRPGERILLHGPNGAGKTTLLRVLAGDLVPSAGTVRTEGAIGYLPQEAPAGDPARTLLQAYAAGLPGPADEHREELLELGLFRPADLHVRVGSLSVGQARRLLLARLVSRPADLLLLDEPTNHLSPTLVEELEAALASYEGAVVVVSHDRLLRRRFGGREVGLSEGRLRD